MVHVEGCRPGCLIFPMLVVVLVLMAAGFLLHLGWHLFGLL
jgi:hypothetical protein